MGERKRRRDDGRPELRSDAKDDTDELTLSYSIAFGNPADLALSDRVHRFVNSRWFSERPAPNGNRGSP
jgi:hypothetical protein